MRLKLTNFDFHIGQLGLKVKDVKLWGELSTVISESLAGRVGSLEVGTFKMNGR